jgi:hypothetical protein
MNVHAQVGHEGRIWEVLTHCALGDSQDMARNVAVECLASMVNKVRRQAARGTRLPGVRCAFFCLRSLPCLGNTVLSAVTRPRTRARLL